MNAINVRLLHYNFDIIRYSYARMAQSGRLRVQFARMWIKVSVLLFFLSFQNHFTAIVRCRFGFSVSKYYLHGQNASIELQSPTANRWTFSLQCQRWLLSDWICLTNLKSLRLSLSKQLEIQNRTLDSLWVLQKQHFNRSPFTALRAVNRVSSIDFNRQKPSVR